MSIAFDDKSQASSSGGRFVKRSLSKTNLGLNPDSPRTMEACRELGILPQDLTQKAPETFAEDAPDEEIAQLRYNHYIIRYNQTLRDVMAKRREISLAQGGALTIDHTSSSHLRVPALGASASNLNNLNATGNLGSASNLSHSRMKSPTLDNTIPLSPQFLANYNKTVSYLRTSHDTPRIKTTRDLNLTLEDEDTKVFDIQLSQEIEKFNASKKLKQKEALKKYSDDLKRIKMVADIQERMKKKEEMEKQNKILKIKIREENRKRAEEKMSTIRSREGTVEELRASQEKEIKKRLEHKKLKLEQERELRLKKFEELNQRHQEKKLRAELIRDRHTRELANHIEEVKQKLDDRMAESQEKVEMTLQSKIDRIKEHIEKLNQKVNEIKEDRVVEEEEFISSIVHKVKDQELKNLEFEKKREQMYKEKMKRIKERNQQFAENARSVRMSQKEKISNLEQKLVEAKKRIEEQKNEEQNEFRKRQELRRLKVLDTQENYLRKKRIIEFEQERILEKERQNAERLKLLRAQKEIVQKARLEASQQSKIERERIAYAITEISKYIRPLNETEKALQEKLEAEREERLQMQLPPQMQMSPDQKKAVASPISKELKVIHNKGYKKLSKYIDMGPTFQEEIDKIIGVKVAQSDQNLDNPVTAEQTNKSAVHVHRN